MAQDLSVSLKINSDTSGAHSDVQQLGQAMEELGAASKTAEKDIDNEAAALKRLQAELARSAADAGKLSAAQDALDSSRSTVKPKGGAQADLPSAQGLGEKDVDDLGDELKQLQAELALSTGDVVKFAASLEALRKSTILDEKRRVLSDYDLKNRREGNAPTPTAAPNGGIPSYQIEQAMRYLPAQLTDAGISLASGMPAYLVALQQGGQIMDSFGGFSSMFTHLTPLITATRVALAGAVAGVAALAMAYNEGSQEGDAYTKALVMSGNAAGTTVDQLADMAANIDQVTGTQAKAAEVLAQLASTGMDADKLQKFAQVAVQVEESLGQSASETIKAFDELGKAPMAATLKYNDALHYLTASVYEQIEALMEQGKTEEAGAVAQQAYAQAMISGVTQMDASLGIFQRSWRALGRTASEAWDLILGVGRPDTLQSTIEQAEKRVRELDEQLAPSSSYATPFEVETGQERKALAALKAQQKQAAETAKAQADLAKSIEERAAAEKDNAKWTEAALTPLEKMNKALERYRQNNQKKIAGGDKLDPKQVAAEEAALKKSLEKSGGGGGGRSRAPTAFQTANAEAAVEMAKLKANLSLLQDTIKNGDAIIVQAFEDGNVTLEAAYAARLSQMQTDTAAQREALQAEMDEADKALAKAKTAFDSAPLKQKKIDIAAKLMLLDSSLQEATRKLGIWKTDQEKQLANITAKVRIEVAGLTGQFDRSAVEAQIKAQYEGDYNAAGQLSGDGEQTAEEAQSKARKNIDMLVRAGVAQAEFNAKLAEAQRLQNQLSVQEEATNTLATQGVISQTEADIRLRQGRADQVPQLQAIVQQLRSMRDAMPPKAAAAIDQMSVSIAQLDNTVKAAVPAVVNYGTKLKNTVIDGLADAAASAMTNFSNLREMVGSTLKGMAADIMRSGVKEALNYVLKGKDSSGSSFISTAISAGKAHFVIHNFFCYKSMTYELKFFSLCSG